MKPLNIVFLSQRFPLPGDTGGKIRTGNLLRQLHRRHRVTLVGNFDADKDAPWQTEIGQLCGRYVPVPWHEPGRWSLRAWLRRAVVSATRLPAAAAWDSTAALRHAVEQVCRQESPDVLVCDFVYASLNCLAITSVPKVLFEHNVESEIARRHYETARNPLLRAFWRVQAAWTRDLELLVYPQFDTVVTVTERDRATIAGLSPRARARSISSAVDCEYFQPIGRLNLRRLLFVGSLDWLPNGDSLRFFFNQVFPRLLGRLPDLQVRIVGRRPPRWLRRLAARSPNVELTGWVPDIRTHADDCGVFIMPLHVGGGSRVKALEAAAMGIPIVSTAIGVEGLPLEAGSHYLRADTAEEFAAAIVQLAEDPRRAESMARAARNHVCGRFTWEKAAQDFEDACQSAVELFRGRASESEHTPTRTNAAGAAATHAPGQDLIVGRAQ